MDLEIFIKRNCSFLKLFWTQIAQEARLPEEELTRLYTELETHLADPKTRVVSPLLFQAWGDKPSGREKFLRQSLFAPDFSVRMVASM